MTTSRDLLAHRQALLADEQGTLHKVAPLRVALCYPSPYHVGMSSLGFQTIYREIHAAPRGERRAGLSRPTTWMPSARAGRPSSPSSRRTPVAELPVLAFSVAYELELPGLLDVLEPVGDAGPRGGARAHAAPGGRRGAADLLQPRARWSPSWTCWSRERPTS